MKMKHTVQPAPSQETIFAEVQKFTGLSQTGIFELRGKGGIAFVIGSTVYAYTTPAFASFPRWVKITFKTEIEARNYVRIAQRSFWINVEHFII